MPPCSLLAIDLDGTLLDRSHRVAARTREALHRAHAAGIRIVLCTGRSFTETRPVLAQIGLDLDATVTVGGALISDAATGATLECTPFEPEIAARVLDWFIERRYVSLWLHDGCAAGFDGYVIDGAIRHAAVDLWLAMSGCRMEAVARPPAGRAPLRIAIVDDSDALVRLSAEFADAFGDETTHNVIDVPSLKFTVIEAFAARVSKWSGILGLCRRWGIDPAATVAVGDDVNDVSMLRGAALGVAMGNAVPAARDAADWIIGDNGTTALADLIDSLADGRPLDRVPRSAAC